VPKVSTDPSDAQLEDHVFADLAASFLSPEIFEDRTPDGDAKGGEHKMKEGVVVNPVTTLNIEEVQL
jgi:hypothetical protein